MIHSARPLVTPVANIVFCCFVFLDMKSGDVCPYGQHVRKQWSLPSVTLGWPSGSKNNFPTWNIHLSFNIVTLLRGKKKYFQKNKANLWFRVWKRFVIAYWQFTFCPSKSFLSVLYLLYFQVLWYINSPFWPTRPRRPNRWSLFSRMVSVRPENKENKTRDNAKWGLVGH